MGDGGPDSTNRFDSTSRYVVGVDVGGTNVRGAVVHLGNDRPWIVAERSSKVTPGSVAVDIEATIASLLADLDRGGPGLTGTAPISTGLTSTGLTGTSEVVGIGVGIAGHVSREGIMVQSAHLKELVGVDLAAQLAHLAPVVVVENDANCIGLAAHQLGFPHSDLLLSIGFGTGIGAAIVADGQLLKGARGLAGEAGHMIVEQGGRRCACGQRGCWETYASGSALTRAINDVFGSRESPSSTESKIADSGAIAVFAEAMTSGDPDALGLFEDYCKHVATGVASLIQLLDPDVICFGGGVSTIGEPFIDGVRRELDTQLSGFANRNTVLAIAPSSASAGVIGAALSVPIRAAD